MKIRTGERHTLNDLSRESRTSTNPYAKEKLNQYMEDLRTKYHLSINDSVDLITGEILPKTVSNKGSGEKNAK